MLLVPNSRGPGDWIQHGAPENRAVRMMMMMMMDPTAMFSPMKKPSQTPMFLSIRPFLCGSLLGNFRLPNCSLLKICSYIKLQIPQRFRRSNTAFKLCWKKKTTNVSAEKKTEMFHGQKFSYPFDFPSNKKTKKKTWPPFATTKKIHTKPKRRNGIFPPPAICCVAT